MFYNSDIVPSLVELTTNVKTMTQPNLTLTLLQSLTGMESSFWKWGGLSYGPLAKSGGAQPCIYSYQAQIMGGPGPPGPLDDSIPA